MIVFNCSQCGKQLKVKDDGAGRAGRCPSCDMILKVPHHTPTPPVETQPPAPPVVAVSPAAKPQDKTKPASTREESTYSRIVADSVASEALDRPMQIALWAGAVGLLVLAVSPLFRWITLGPGGITGINGDGKIVLGVTVAAAVFYAIASLTKKNLVGVSLGVGLWGTVAMFWMAGLIWKVGSPIGSDEAKTNPFAALLATQIGAGAGLYLGLAGGLIIAASLGYVAFKRSTSDKPWLALSITQSVAVVLGILIAISVGPGKPSPSGAEASNPFAREEKAPTQVSIGSDVRIGQIQLKPLGVCTGPIALVAKNSFSDSPRQYPKSAIMLAVQVTNISDGQVFGPVASMDSAWEVCKVTDNYGNSDGATDVCQFTSWPASGQIGQEPSPLKPGKSAVLVFVIRELSNPKASEFTWTVKCRTDNKFSEETISVATSANQVKSRPR